MKFFTASLLSALTIPLLSQETYDFYNTVSGGGGLAFSNAAVNWSKNGVQLESGTFEPTSADTINISNSKGNGTIGNIMISLNQNTWNIDKLVTTNVGSGNNIAIKSYAGSRSITANELNHTFLDGSTGQLVFSSDGANNVLSLTFATVNLTNETSGSRSVFFGSNDKSLYWNYYNSGLGSLSASTMNVTGTKAYFQGSTSSSTISLGNVKMTNTAAASAELVLKYHPTNTANVFSTETQNVYVSSLSSGGIGHGRISVEGNYNGNLRINGTSGVADFNGAIINASDGGSGKVAVYKTADGTQILSGANTYTGYTQVSGGTLALNHEGTTAATTTGVWLNGNATFGNYGKQALTLNELDWSSGGLYVDFGMTDFSVMGANNFAIIVDGDVYFDVGMAGLNGDYFTFLNIININPDMTVGDSTGNIRVVVGDFTEAGSGTKTIIYTDEAHEWEIELSGDDQGFYMNATLSAFIPEPSTYAAVLGALALALAAYRKKRK